MKQFNEVHGNYPNAILRCPFDKCGTRLIKLSPSLVSTEVELKNAPAMSGDSTYFFRIDDVWDFDNIGVSRVAAELEASKEVGQLAKVERLLVCSECDKGPLGFAGYQNADETQVEKLCYYLSCESVLYDAE